MYRALPLSLCAALALVAPAALATRNVSTPVVKDGQYWLESRIGYETDDAPAANHRLRQTDFFDYGVNDWLALRVTGRFSKARDDTNRFAALELQQRMQYAKQDRDGYDASLNVTYARAELARDADSLGLAWLAQTKIGRFQHRVNLEGKYEIGPQHNAGPILSASYQALTPITDSLDVGGEWFADIGNLYRQNGVNSQSHSVGPVLNWKLNSNYSVQTGYLVGVSKPASDGLFKLFFKALF